MTPEQRKKKHLKELNSLKNKLTGKSLVWFDSLGKKKQWDLLFEWKQEKFHNKLSKPEVKYFKRRRRKLVMYPASLKHFIREKMGADGCGWGKWRVNKSAYRNSAIDILIGDIEK
jgi:hypothetical protein